MTAIVSDLPSAFTEPALFTQMVPSVKLFRTENDALILDTESIDVRQVLAHVFGIPAAEVDEEMVEVATDELALDTIYAYEVKDRFVNPVVGFARERMVSEVLSTLVW